MNRIVITVGGTGGHVYPALALAEQFAAEQIDFLFVGGNLSKNRYFNAAQYPNHTVSCSTFSKPWKIPLALCKISKGIWESHAILRKYKPDLIVGFGSYYTLPTLLAARWLKIPFILHEANSIPGKVNRFLAPHALMTAVHFPSTCHLLKGQTVVSGMPLRQGFKKGTLSKKEALNYFGLKEPAILVFGGSQGAQALNFPVQTSHAVIHLTGDEKIVDTLAKQYKSLGIHACVKPFEHQMSKALAAADVAYCRAGASTIAELIEYEIPALLIPFPQAAENHQEHNAKFLSDTVGGGITLPERFMDAKMVHQQLNILLNEKDKMREKIGAYKNKKNQTELITIIKQVLS